METTHPNDWRARIAAIDPTIANFRLNDHAQVHVHEDRIVFKHKMQTDRSAPADELAFFFDVEHAMDRNQPVRRWQVLKGGWSLERQAKFSLSGLPDLCYSSNLSLIGADSASLVALTLSIVGRHDQFLAFAPSEAAGGKVKLPPVSADSDFTWSDGACCYTINGDAALNQKYLVVGSWGCTTGVNFYPDLFVRTRDCHDTQSWEVYASDGTKVAAGEPPDNTSAAASLSMIVNLIGQAEACHRLVRRRDASVLASRIREIAGDTLDEDADPLRWVAKLRKSHDWLEKRVHKLEDAERRCADLERTLDAAKASLDSQERLDRLRVAIREALKPGASVAAWQRLAGELA